MNNSNVEGKLPKVFISYRRDDNPFVAGMINDIFEQRFGKGTVFFDVDSIPLGMDFRTFIEEAVAESDAFLVVIGDGWLGAPTNDGKRRLDDPTDFVRIEIESALKCNVPIVPVLVGDVSMPEAADLPRVIQDLAFRNSTQIRPGKDLREDLDRLLAGLEAVLAIHVTEPTQNMIFHLLNSL